VSVGGWLAFVAMLAVNSEPDEPWSTSAALAIEALAYVGAATLALLILRARPGHPVGWGAMLAGVGWPLEGLVVELLRYSLEANGPVGPTLVIGWVARWVWIPTAVALPLILFYYPDGALPSRRWRFVPAGLWVVVALTFLLSFTPDVLQEPGLPDLPNPFGVDLPGLVWVLPAAGAITMSLLPYLSGASLLFRLRGATPLLRRQLKLLLWVAIVSVVYFVGLEAIPMGPVVDAVIGTAFTVYVAGSIAAAIIRYRAFDIDRLISRTITYTAVVALLAAVAVGIVALVTTALPVRQDPAVALATLAIAALFNPVVRRVRRWVDRRFDRTAYESRQVMSRFAVDVGHSLTAGELADTCTAAVVDALQPTTTFVWIDETT